MGSALKVQPSFAACARIASVRFFFAFFIKKKTISTMTMAMAIGAIRATTSDGVRAGADVRISNEIESMNIRWFLQGHCFTVFTPHRPEAVADLTYGGKAFDAFEDSRQNILTSLRGFR